MSTVLPPTDEQIVLIVRTTDKEQFVELIRRYQHKLLRYAQYILTDEEMAADAVQEAFIKAYSNLQGFHLNQKFSSWMYRIVHNEAMNLIRKNKVMIVSDEGLNMASAENLEDDFVQQELVQHLHACLNHLPLLYREPIMLYFLEEKSYEEISDILRIPTATVGTRISRAKQIIRKLCQKK